MRYSCRSVCWKVSHTGRRTVQTHDLCARERIPCSLAEGLPVETHKSYRRKQLQLLVLAMERAV